MIFLVWLTPFIYRFVLPEPDEIPAEIRAELDRYFTFWEEKQSKSEADHIFSAGSKDHNKVGTRRATNKAVSSASASTKPFEVEYFNFDPNTLETAGWMRLGFSERQAQVIDNYRSKGGRFYQKEDLRKLYVMSEADYLRIADYVVIAQEPKQIHTADRILTERSAFLHDQPPAIPSMELNSVDSFRLQLLPGIGPAFASRIVRYRDRLGGFYDVDQLLDVYGMDSARWEGLLEYVEVDRQKMQGLRINELDQETLGRHPLIGFKLASIIVRYREHHGAFADAEALKSLGVIDEEIWSKLLPYLQF